MSSFLQVFSSKYVFNMIFKDLRERKCENDTRVTITLLIMLLPQNSQEYEILQPMLILNNVHLHQYLFFSFREPLILHQLFQLVLSCHYQQRDFPFTHKACNFPNISCVHQKERSFKNRQIFKTLNALSKDKFRYNCHYIFTVRTLFFVKKARAKAQYQPLLIQLMGATFSPKF